MGTVATFVCETCREKFILPHSSYGKLDLRIDPMKEIHKGHDVSYYTDDGDYSSEGDDFIILSHFGKEIGRIKDYYKFKECDFEECGFGEYLRDNGIRNCFSCNNHIITTPKICEECEEYSNWEPCEEEE